MNRSPAPVPLRDASTSAFPISVVIPVRNSPSHLLLCLEALMKNRLEDAEIIVVDDASTDDTPQVPSGAFGADFPALRCLSLDRHSGPAAARNEGMRAARNPHVLFLDADILLPPQSLDWIRETLAQNAGKPEVAGIMGVYSEDIPWKGFFTDYKNLYVCFLYKTTATTSPYLHTPILCVNKAILERAGGFDGRLATAEDFRLGILLGSEGYRFIIDRRVRGTHLKRYSLGSLLREDARRIRDLLSIQLDEKQQTFTYRAHRWSRLLSVILPIPALVLAAAAFWLPLLAPAAILSGLIICLCHGPFLLYCGRKRGAVFALRSCGFLFAEMLWAQISLSYWMIRLILRRSASKATL